MTACHYWLHEMDLDLRRKTPGMSHFAGAGEIRGTVVDHRNGTHLQSSDKYISCNWSCVAGTCSQVVGSAVSDLLD